MIRKYIKPLIIALTAFIALFVATGAYAGGYDLFMMPDAGKLNNPSTSVHMLYQMFGPLISEILNPSLNVSENGYLFAYMLKYWNFLVASGAGAFITFHLILAFVKSAENGKFLAGEAEKVGSMLRYALGGFLVAPVIGTGKFCAMQMLFMYGILSGVHAANLLWGTATYGIQMGVTPTIPSNLTSTINTMAGEMYLYDMVDKYTSGTIQEASHLNIHGCPKGEDGKICLHTTGVQVVDLENQPGFESVGNALLNEHSYHYLHNLSGILRLYAAACVGKKLPPNPSYSTLHNNSNCPAFDAWVLRHSVITRAPVVLSCNGVQGKSTVTNEPVDNFKLINGKCESKLEWAREVTFWDATKQAKQDPGSPNPVTSGPVRKDAGRDWDGLYGSTDMDKLCSDDVSHHMGEPGSSAQDLGPQHMSYVDYRVRHECWTAKLYEDPHVSGGKPDYGCTEGYKLSTWDPSTYKVTQIDVTPGTGVCLPDMNSKQQYTKGEWVIDSGIDAIHFVGPKSPESTGISIVDASDRITTGKLPKVAGFERAILIDAGAPGINQSDDISISAGGVISDRKNGTEITGENKKEAALIASLGMDLGPIASDYGFPIMAQSGSPLFYGDTICPPGDKKVGGTCLAVHTCPTTRPKPADPNTTTTTPGMVWYTNQDTECTYKCIANYKKDASGICQSTLNPSCTKDFSGGIQSMHYVEYHNVPDQEHDGGTLKRCGDLTPSSMDPETCSHMYVHVGGNCSHDQLGDWEWPSCRYYCFHADTDYTCSIDKDSGECVANPGYTNIGGGTEHACTTQA